MTRGARLFGGDGPQSPWHFSKTFDAAKGIGLALTESSLKTAKALPVQNAPKGMTRSATNRVVFFIGALSAFRKSRW